MSIRNNKKRIKKIQKRISILSGISITYGLFMIYGLEPAYFTTITKKKKPYPVYAHWV